MGRVDLQSVVAAATAAMRHQLKQWRDSTIIKMTVGSMWLGWPRSIFCCNFGLGCIAQSIFLKEKTLGLTLCWKSKKKREY